MRVGLVPMPRRRPSGTPGGLDQGNSVCLLSPMAYFPQFALDISLAAMV